MVRALRGAWVVVVGLLSLAAGSLAAEPKPPAGARVEFFSPQGTAKQVRQVSARFSVPMVALGDPRLPDPFTLDCPATGKGRWVDPRNWAYDFDEDLPAGVRCTFALRDGLRALDDRAIAGTRKFAFDTGGPAIEIAYPYEGSTWIDEQQVFLLKLDAPATPESVQQHAHCAVAGIPERIPVEVLTDDARRELLAQREQLGYQYYQLLWKDGESSRARVRNRSLEQREERVTVLRCTRTLPSGTDMKLVWGAGVAAASGIATRADQTLPFRVRPAFSASLDCTRTEPRAGCTPTQPINVRFTAPVPTEQALAARLVLAGGQVRAPDLEQRNAKTVEGLQFKAPFPDGAAATLELPAGLTDDAGRTLENASRFPLEVRIDEYPPLAKFSADFGILEAAEGGVLPVTLRNLDAGDPSRAPSIPGHRIRIGNDPLAIADWLRRVAQANSYRGDYVDGTWTNLTGADSVFSESDVTVPLAIPKIEGPKPAEVVGIPLGAPGLYVVELESRRLGGSLLGRDALYHVSTAALVTNLAVHFKWGREGSRVWVTRLDDGRPVAGATVAIHSYCNGEKYWDGATDRDGIAVVKELPSEPESAYGYECSEYTDPREHLLVVATAPPAADRTAAAPQPPDFGFVLSSWSNGIRPYDFGLDVGREYGASLYHTVLDRPLFRAGETVSMKHFARRHVLDGVAVASGIAGERDVAIVHYGSGQRYELKATFDENGVAEQAWQIPAEAKLGEYAVEIARDQRYGAASATFKVEQFRLPTMRASVSGSARPLVGARETSLDLHVSYVAGGGASNMPVTLRTVVQEQARSHPDHADFSFGGEPVREGVEVRAGGDYDYDFEAPSAEQQAGQARVIPLQLDKQGAARVSINGLPEVKKASVLTAELEYPDANGELRTATGRVSLVPAELEVGIRREGWVASSEQTRFRVVVLDLAGKPVARQPVAATLYAATRYSYRKRLIGGFYTYETTQENKRLDVRCEGRTNAQGLLLCEVAPGVSGEVLVRVETQDASSRTAGATTSIWVAGGDDMWFGGTAGDRMDLLPEEQEYEVGDVARFQVRMPFRDATALVTVEREGVLRSFVTKLSGRAPVVKVPIEAADSPGVYVSVLAVRGRVKPRSFFRKVDESKEITALVDLNKPAYRLGMAEIRVGWKPHRLDVRVRPDRPAYRIREQARVQVEVARADGGALPAGAEIALAAVDEALLDLAPNRTWDLLDAMMGKRGLEVWTSTAQLQVVGKRHYGRKAVPHGGGGGREQAREQFDTLLTWLGRVKLDADGRATLSVPLNDSLTAFKIVAVAHAGPDLFGTGSASIATSQELILLSGLPPVVREGDAFAATFSVRNTTQASLAVDLAAEVAPQGALPAQRVEIPAGEARDVTWQVSVPVGASALAWDVSASHSGGSARDRVKVSQKVLPVYPVRTYQATIAQLTKPLEIPAEIPKGAVPGRGGLEVALRAKLGDGLDGVREYMSAYPYICLEQNVSRAVALQDRELWDAWMARLPAYQDRDGLLKYFPSSRLEGEDSLTAYVAQIADETGWEIPESARNAMLEGLKGFVEGRVLRRSALDTADLAIRKLAAINALARFGKAQPAMLDSITLEPNLWPTSAVIDWLGILRSLPEIPRAAQKREQGEGILRTRLNFQGTIMTFSSERTDALWWLMISADSNAVRALIELHERPQWREDVPRLVRGALGRQQFGHWNTTLANAWGVVAMQKFSAAFESVPVTGATELRYGAQTESVPWPQPDTAERSLPWQAGPLPLVLRHAGTGGPWAIVRATAALPLDGPLSTGFKVARSITPVTQQRPGRWSRGDTARVRLELEAQSDMSWVVVDDPVPGGATILGSGLGGQSQLLQQGERSEGFAWLAFEERRFDAFRAYYRFVPKGKWVVEYTVRLNNPGTFLLPATRVEAMYAPEMLGEVPNAPLSVEPAP